MIRRCPSWIALLLVVGLAPCCYGQRFSLPVAPGRVSPPLPAKRSSTSINASLNPVSIDPPATLRSRLQLFPPTAGEDRYEDRIKRIQEKMRKLAAHQKKTKEACATDAPTPTAVAPRNSEPIPRPIPEPIPQPQTLTPLESPTLTRPTSDSSLQTQPSATPTPATAPQLASEAPDFIVSSTPIDSLAFANNLFAQGKIDVARPVYEKLLTQPQDPDDLVWIQYQLASCYRLEKRIKDATKFYRLVASDKTGDYWPSRARWWMDYISRAESMQGRQTGLEERLKALQEKAVALQQ